MNLGGINMKNILSVEKIEKYYGNKGNITKAIDNISFKHLVLCHLFLSIFDDFH